MCRIDFFDLVNISERYMEAVNPMAEELLERYVVGQPGIGTDEDEIFLWVDVHLLEAAVHGSPVEVCCQAPREGIDNKVPYPYY